MPAQREEGQGSRPKEEQKGQHWNGYPGRMAVRECLWTSCPKPGRAPCTKQTAKIQCQWCIELAKEPRQQMSLGNREAPVFPFHAGFAILPCLIAKAVINTLQAESDAVTEPHGEQGKEIVSNLHA